MGDPKKDPHNEKRKEPGLVNKREQLGSWGKKRGSSKRHKFRPKKGL